MTSSRRRLSDSEEVSLSDGGSVGGSKHGFPAHLGHAVVALEFVLGTQQFLVTT